MGAGADEALDSDADPAMDGMTDPVVLESGEENNDLDAGIYEPASIGDFVFEDTDGDGKFDKSTIFADKMTMPEGALWLDGALYIVLRRER